MDPRAVIVLIMLLGASWSDLQTRRVRNRFWLPFLVVAAILWTVSLLEDGSGVLWLAVYALIATALLYGMWYMGFFGGADAKGLMVVAWLWPGAPDVLAGALIPVLDMLINGTVIMLALPVVFFVWNLLRGQVRFPAMFLGTRMATGEARARHVWPLQRIVDGRLAWKYWNRPSEGLDAAYGALARHGHDVVWVTPKVPFMLPLSLGAVFAATHGNLLLQVMARVL